MKCPNCGGADLRNFYECPGVPAQSNLLFRSKQEAVDISKGDVVLAFCSTCQFIANTAFDPALENYGADYEATQSHSPTFNAFHKKLAEDLISRYDLRRRDIIEIGCGQGEFLELLCELGENRGIGFDPAYQSSGQASAPGDRMRVVPDYFSEEHLDHSGDFICCKMTLEHIPDTAGFVQVVRSVVGDRRDTVVFFQVPDVTPVLSEVAFWDIYYEHCSYFCPASLAYLFRKTGFDVIDCSVQYGGQYLMIEARSGSDASPDAANGTEGDITDLIEEFERRVSEQRAEWRNALDSLRDSGRRTVLWGGGSKAVGFLTTLKAGPEIEFVVDINPNKQGTFMPGTGHEIVAPERLTDSPPDIVIVMNPVYLEEVRNTLRGLDIDASLMSLTASTDMLLELAGANVA